MDRPELKDYLKSRKGQAMGRREQRVATEMSLARINGQRWGVAMCDTEWAKFSDQICPDARVRLLAILDHFCDYGEANLPRGAFRWLSPDPGLEGAARQGAFEARGVVVRGRAAPQSEQQMFFVTAIEQDPPGAPPSPKPSRRREPDGRQAHLPLSFTATERN
ncbi:hypothetical protein [Sphingomonas sp. KR3-1]|uniref:hypothetical protein n=1 Tax=Sphingomonas sp. KR3-1 TaxID=3156611 RepID=UPI0032B404A9